MKDRFAGRRATRRATRGGFALCAALCIALCVALCAALAVSCQPGAETRGTRFLIGVSQANLSEPWRVAMNGEIRAEASKWADLRVIYADAGDSSARQIADVARFLELGVDLVIISPTDSRALTPAVRDAYARVPVIVLDRAVEGYDYSLFIGPDNVRLGREAGAFASALLGAGGGTVLEVQGRAGSPPALERSQGFTEEIAKNSGARTAPPLVADWLRDRAEDEFAAALRKKPRVDVVFAQNDAMAYGAFRAARAAGVGGIRIIGIDGLPGPTGGIELVRNGALSATFTCPTGGKEAVIYGMDLLLGKEGIPKKVFLRPTKVTAATLSGAEPPAPRASWSPGGRKIVLGFAQVGTESEWRLANTESIIDAATKAGIDLVLVDGQQSRERQIAAIRSFIARRVDVIALSPVVADGWEEALREARAAGIPVILSDRTVSLKDDSLWLSFMGSDFREEGRRAARWLVDYMKPSGPVGVAELRGTEGSAPAIDRKAGFEEVLADNPAFRIVASESGGFFKDEGYKAMKRILAARGGEIGALFAHNDDMAVGAIKAIEEAGLRPGVDIVIVSIDAAHGAFQAMVDGKLNCTVECNPLLGPQLMKAVVDYMEGKDLPLRMITAEGVFPAKTARAEMPGRRY